MDTNKNLNVMFASSEMMPFAKTGGLADVVSSLPKALSNLGNVDARMVIPKYGFIYDSVYELKELSDIVPGLIVFHYSGFLIQLHLLYPLLQGSQDRSYIQLL